MRFHHDGCVVLALLALILHVVRGENEFYRSNYAKSRNIMVHLFEWRWEDIANECETFLGPMQYAGVQVSPPNENAIVTGPWPVYRPWYERYQPVSYKLETRSGCEEQFRDMVRRCHNVGVRIYVDAVINHMTGPLAKGTPATGGSPFDSDRLSYPAVPYGPDDFNSQAKCKLCYSDEACKTRDCELVELKDLNQQRPHVRDKIREYLQHLLNLGVAGFRIDAAKHMRPSDLQSIYNDLYLSEEFFPANTRPLIFQEVISYTDADAINRNDYTRMARVTEFRYGQKLSNVFRGKDLSKWLQNFGEAWNFLDPNASLVFVDNHDNQRSNDGDVLTFFEPEPYLKALTFMMAWPYGLVRIISSYRWPRSYQNNKDVNQWIGPPHDDNFNIRPVKFQSDGSCMGGWVCEHRWPAVAKMVRFSVVAQDEPVLNWWDNGANQIAFSRGTKAFYAVNNEDRDLREEITTSLPPGRYCNIITGDIVNGKCIGRLVTVYNWGALKLNLPVNSGESIVAIHVEAMAENFEEKFANEDWQLTVILVHKISDEPVKIEGGVNLNARPECLDDASLCSIPIRDGVLEWGTPSNIESAWSTNDRSSSSFDELNKYGPDYWIFKIEMDCSKTFYGFFDVRVLSVDGAEEPTVVQDDECGGDYSVESPYQSSHHMAMCGKINVFRYGSGSCRMNYFD